MATRQRHSVSLFCLSAIAILAFSPQANARGQVTARTMGTESREMFSDFGYILRSPVRADRGEWAVVGLTGLGFAALLPADRPVDRWVVKHPNALVLRVTAPFREESGPLDRLVTAKQLVPISAALVLAGAITDRRGLREAGLGCIAGWGVSNVLRYATYAVISRDRPSAADGNSLAFAVPGGEWDQHSFPAGHATNAFACTSFWNTRFDLSVGEPVLYAVATLSSLARIADRRHWTSDTFVGVVVGFAIGQTVAHRYAVREARRDLRARAELAAGAGASKPADRATHHDRLVGSRPVVVLWRASF